MKEIVGMAKKKKKRPGVKGFKIWIVEISEICILKPEELPQDDFMQMSASEPVPDEEGEDVEGAVPGN